VKKLPTKEESEQIKKEIEELPPTGWMKTMDDSAAAVLRAHQIRQAAFVAAAGTGASTFPIALTSWPTKIPDD
jgi:hypothetical protein